MPEDPDILPEDATEAFVRLLTRHERDLYRYIVSLMPMGGEPDDVMQETATLLWKKFADYDRERPFLPWAMRFAYFEVLKQRKRLGKSRLIFSDELLATIASDYAGEEPVLRSRRGALDACLAKLSDRDRDLLRRRYASRETISDLAAEAGRSVHKLYYALERIRENLMLCVDRTLRKEGWDVR